MRKATVLLVAVPFALGACSGGGHPKAAPTYSTDLAGMRAAMSTLTSVQFDQIVTLGRKMCAADTSGFAVMEATMADQGTTDVGRQMIHFMCPARSAEYSQLPHANKP